MSTMNDLQHLTINSSKMCLSLSNVFVIYSHVIAIHKFSEILFLRLINYELNRVAVAREKSDRVIILRKMKQLKAIPLSSSCMWINTDVLSARLVSVTVFWVLLRDITLNATAQTVMFLHENFIPITHHHQMDVQSNREKHFSLLFFVFLRTLGVFHFSSSRKNIALKNFFINFFVFAINHFYLFRDTFSFSSEVDHILRSFSIKSLSKF
jgi:hypothetical protein